MGATPQNVELFVCCSTPEAIAYLVFALSRSINVKWIFQNAWLYSYIASWLYNETHNITEMKHEVWWVQYLIII